MKIVFRFRFIPGTAGIIWKTQTILEHSVDLEKLQEVSGSSSARGVQDGLEIVNLLQF